MTGNIVPELLGPARSPDDDDDVILQNGLCWDNFMIKHFFQMPLGLGRHLLATGVAISFFKIYCSKPIKSSNAARLFNENLKRLYFL